MLEMCGVLLERVFGDMRGIFDVVHGCSDGEMQ